MSARITEEKSKSANAHLPLNSEHFLKMTVFLE